MRFQFKSEQRILQVGPFLALLGHASFKMFPYRPPSRFNPRISGTIKFIRELNIPTFFVRDPA